MAQSPMECTFSMNSSLLPDSQQVFITGNHEELGYWDPGLKQMTYAGNHTWALTIQLPGPIGLEYKYTLGTWEKEGADGKGNALANFNIEVGSDTVISDTIPGWTDRQPWKKPDQTILGKTDHYPQMKGRDLRDRDVIVWLPPGYGEDPDQRYPVIYLHDGQNMFNAATSAFGTEWRVDESIDSLSAAGVIPPMIAVGIYNTPDRSAEYLPGDTALIYMDFIVNRLKPFIDSAYRTLPEAANTINGGASAGGTIAFMLVWEHPEVFSKGICMSPALKIHQYDYVRVVESSPYRKDIFLYMDIGGMEIEAALRPGVQEMADVLQNRGYERGKDYIVVEEPGASHNEAAWAKRFPEALKLCIQKEVK